MMLKKVLAVTCLPFLMSPALARTLHLPKPEIEFKTLSQNRSKYVLKNAKGTLLQSSLEGLTLDNWFNLSPVDGAEGIRTEESYARFGVPTSEDIIVAVIDSGVDVNHEDLQGKVWINDDEIPGDGIDNDNNGYIDDVFGWNFIGGSNGMATIVKDDSLGNGLRLVKGNPSAQVEADTLEVTRELIRMKKLKKSVEELGEFLSLDQEFYLMRTQSAVDKGVKEAQDVITNYTSKLKTYKSAEELLLNAGISEITLERLRTFESEDPGVLDAKATMISFLSQGMTETRMNRILDYYGDQLQYYYNQEFDPRSIVGDNYLDQKERYYGNNDVIGPDSSHGTHVSGIIAAARDNGLGIKGVATNVKIMAIRVVPNGDERDKDVANGIRYAVDNGAKIINMSFGKKYSPYKRTVDEAVAYAESKGVLLVHAAGNDNKDNDSSASFPKRNYLMEDREFNNWLEIGASSSSKGLSLVAGFSNYGKKTVDFFAPGVDILSTTPENTYDTYSGTSMAAPTAAGAAALILSYAPDLDADAVKALMIDTSRRYPRLMVNRPGSETQVPFSSLSTYGSIVDVFESVKFLE